jgi:hypothetical protein
METPRHYEVKRDVLLIALMLDGLYWTSGKQSARTAMLKLLRGAAEFSCAWPRRSRREEWVRVLSVRL